MSDIDKLIQALSAPLTNEEREDGWNEESKRAMCEYFKALRTPVEAGHIPDSLVHVARALDHWGVRSGRLSDLAISISSRFRKGKGA